MHFRRKMSTFFGYSPVTMRGEQKTGGGRDYASDNKVSNWQYQLEVYISKWYYHLEVINRRGAVAQHGTSPNFLLLLF